MNHSTRMQELHKARKQIEWAFEQCGLDPSEHVVMVGFNSRFTRRMGDASAKKNYDWRPTLEIRLSLPLWPRATEEERRETVIHEACHIIDYVINGKMCGHGRPWKRLMEMCGLRAERKSMRCHSVDRTGLSRRRARVAATCMCGVVSEIGPIQAKKIRGGSVYRCRRCKTPVNLV